MKKPPMYAVVSASYKQVPSGKARPARALKVVWTVTLTCGHTIQYENPRQQGTEEPTRVQCKVCFP